MLEIIAENWWSVVIGSLLSVIVYLFTHPEKIAIWSSLIAGVFERFSKRSARHSVSSDIQGRISAYIKSYDAKDILPYGLKLKWISGDDFSSYVDDEDVVVIMDYHNNNARNFVNAIKQYTSKAFLPTVKHKLPREVVISAELIMQEKIITAKRPDALDIFHNDHMADELAQNNKVRLFHDIFKRLDILGFFDNIFLTELTFAGHRLEGLEPSQKNSEMRNFLNYLENISNESSPLDYRGRVFSVQIILVAKFIKRVYEGTAPYTHRAQQALSNKINSIYVTGRDKNIDFVKEVVTDITNMKIGNLEWIRSYNTLDRKKKRKKAIVALFRL